MSITPDLPPMREDNHTDMEQQLSTKDTKFLLVSLDKTTVTYVGKGSHSHDVGISLPLSTDKPIGYFEVSINNKGARGSICIGLSKSDFQLNRQPGWDSGSYGYDGSDGKKLHSSMLGDNYSDPFNTNDVIGCGINYKKGEIFFTRNGTFLGTAFRRVRGDLSLYPTVGLHSQGESVTFHFGKKKPFLFNIQHMIEEEEGKFMVEVESKTVSRREIHELIRGYLIFHGYSDTLSAFEKSSDSTDDDKNSDDVHMRSADDGSEFLLQTLQKRREIRSNIMNGDVLNAIRCIEDDFPRVMDEKRCMRTLRSQHFVELLKKGQTMDAITFGQSMVGDTMEDDEDENKIFSLLAYPKPEQSPLASLFSVQQREKVADVVNQTIIQTCGGGENQWACALEKCMRQLLVIQDHLSQRMGGVQPFDLSKYL